MNRAIDWMIAILFGIALGATLFFSM